MMQPGKDRRTGLYLFYTGPRQRVPRSDSSSSPGLIFSSVHISKSRLTVSGVLPFSRRLYAFWEIFSIKAIYSCEYSILRRSSLSFSVTRNICSGETVFWYISVWLFAGKTMDHGDIRKVQCIDRLFAAPEYQENRCRQGRRMRDRAFVQTG